MRTPLNVLILEDREDDAELQIHELRRAGYDPMWSRVETEKEFRASLRPALDVILADFQLPDFDALRALDILNEYGRDIPFIIVTGALGDETAVECLNRGAADYLLKDRLARLGQAVGKAIKERDYRLEKQESSRIIRTAEKKYRSIFENAEEGIFQTACDGRFLVANPTTARILGYDTPADLIGNLVDLQNRFHVDPAKRAELLETLEKHRAVRGFEARVYRKDGTIIWVSISARAIQNRDGEITHYESTMQEISQRKEAEQQIRDQANLLNLAHDAIVVRDMDDTIRYWNRSAERLHGIASEDAIGTKIISQIYQDKAAVFNAKEQLLKTGDWQGELRLARREGIKRIADSSWTLVRNDANTPKAVLVIDTDITDRKELEQQVLRSQRMESIGTLASGIAHDLNNILTPILASTALLRADLSDEAFERTLGTIENSAQRGAEIVKQVLTFARGADGDRIPTEVSPLANEVVEIASKTFPKSIDIRTAVSEDLRLIVGDPTQIQQMLVNLCINARDAMPDGGILTIGAENVELEADEPRLNVRAEPGPYVELSVRDTGTGIPNAIQDKIFDPFFTTKQPGQGTGLGLSSLVGILKGHQGAVAVDTQPGKGSCFRLYLPALPLDANIEEQSVSAPEEIGEGGLILVVDDEPSVREITKTILEAAGYDVIATRNGSEALTVFEARGGEILLTLTDLLMPSTGGFEFIRSARKLHPNARFIACSGCVSDSDHPNLEDRLRSIGVHVFLQKPFKAEDLLFALEKSLNS